MVSVGFGGFIPFVGFGETTIDYTLLAISLAFMLVSLIYAMKTDSIPLRITAMLVCFGMTIPMNNYGMMWSVFSILFGMAILARTVYDVFDRGPEV